MATLASVLESQFASSSISDKGSEERMRYQDMLKEWTPEEKLAHRGFKSITRAKGFRSIWGMARRHAKAGNKWFPIKESYLRARLGYKNKACAYDLIKALCDLEVLVPHPGNGALDRNLYRWALPTNIWKKPPIPKSNDDNCPY